MSSAPNHLAYTRSFQMILALHMSTFWNSRRHYN